LTTPLSGCAQGVEPAPPINPHQDAASSAGGDPTGGAGGGSSGAAGSMPTTTGAGGTASADDAATGGGVGDDAGGDEAGDVTVADGGPVDAGSDAFDSGPLDAGPGSGPIVHYPFDETIGAVAVDSSGNNRNATAIGGYTWAPGKKGNAIKLDGVSGYVALPVGVISALTNMTLATWVQLEVAVDWQRIIDFGNNATVQMFLVPQNKETGVMRFVLTTTGKPGQQLVNGPSPLPVAVWKHVAVVLNGATAQLYVDGASVASMGGFTLHPSSLGNTANNWIGRSQLAVDPYFKGMVDDFRIYDRALTTAEIVALVSN
jgi:hypothetical protein